MSVYLLKVTGKREKEKPVTVSREIIGELPPDPHYWDAITEFLPAQGVLIDGQATTARLAARYRVHPHI